MVDSRVEYGERNASNRLTTDTETQRHRENLNTCHSVLDFELALYSDTGESSGFEQLYKMDSRLRGNDGGEGFLCASVSLW